MESTFEVLTVNAVSLTKGPMIFITICLMHGMSAKKEVQIPTAKSNKTTENRVSKIYPRKMWPDAIIPYVVDCSIANVHGAKNIIRAAMAEWENRTCIRFIKRTNQIAYLLIRRHNGCWGDVGYKRGRAMISMGDGCEYKFVMMHELGHIIGFNHEHNRADRDEYINIFWDNIANSMIKQFYKRRSNDEFDGKLPYDYSSIMHYKYNAFSKNRTLQTIEIKDKNLTEKHNPYSYITDLDVRKTEEMYNCSITAKSKKNGKREKMHQSDSVAVVSLMSSRRITSIIVNGKEMSRNRRGMNIVLLSYLSGKPTLSIVYDIKSKGGGSSFGHFLNNIPRRYYFLIVSKIYSFKYLREARKALESIGGHVPTHIQPGSAFCFVGYKGYESIHMKQVITEPREKAFLSMNISLAEEFGCQDDIPGCARRAAKGHCKKYPLYLLKACQRSCQACFPGKPCVDENKKCEEWAKKKYCSKFADYMLRRCKVSCNICRKALPAKGSKKSVNTEQRVERKNERVTTKRSGEEEESGDDYRAATGKRCTDKSSTCPVWADRGRCLTDAWVQKNCLISCNTTNICDTEQLRPEGNCSEPLGLGWDLTLPDSAFNASSALKPGGWEATPSNARLYMEDDFISLRIGCWCAKDPPKKTEWLRIDFGEVKNITAIATQGRFRFYEHVKSYKLSFSIDGKEWKFYTEKNRVKIFKGNCDHITPVLNIFGRSLTARFLKVHPILYYGGMCMRVEVYGCNFAQEN